MSDLPKAKRSGAGGDSKVLPPLVQSALFSVLHILLGSSACGTEKHLGLSTTCWLISALCVRSWDSSKAQSTEEPRALPVHGREKYTDSWEGRRGICLEKQEERLGSFQEAVPGLLTCILQCAK